MSIVRGGQRLHGSELATLLGRLTSIYPVGPSAEMSRASRAMRKLASRIVGADDDNACANVAAALESLADEFGPGVASRFESAAREPTGYSTYPMGTHPVLGDGNPIAPPVTVEADPASKVVFGYAHYGLMYEGLPGSVYGGHIAAGFDAVLGIAAALSGRPVVAGSLMVRYLEPTPIGVDLRYEGQLNIVGDSAVQVSGYLMLSDGTSTSEAEAVFVSAAASCFVASTRNLER